MPFALKMHYLPGSRPKWEMEGPTWLDGATLPVGKELVREFYASGYRDRYLILSAKELRDWHEKVLKAISVPPSPGEAKQLAEFEAHISKAGDWDVYVAHWYEWESGL